MKTWLASLIVGFLTGCSSTLVSGGAKNISPAGVRVFLPPFANATEDEHAGRALTELTASALLKKGVPLVQTEAGLVKSRAENAAGPEGMYLDAARSMQATHLLIGTVHEYRYKADLNSRPVVGISLRLVDARNGWTLWQGSSGHSGIFTGSLTAAAQHAVKDLIDQLPIPPGKAEEQPGAR